MNNLFTLFLLVNAVFWGLFPHRTHCRLLSRLGTSTCPPHLLHIITGIISFIGAVVVRQGLPNKWN